MPFQQLSRSLFALARSKPLLVALIAFAALGVLGAGLKYLEEDAKKQQALKPKDRSLLAKINPFLAAPSPSPTPQLSKEYIYAGKGTKLSGPLKMAISKGDIIHKWK